MSISSMDSKIWLDINKTPPEPIFVDPTKSNHSDDVVKHPEKYGLRSNYFKDRTPKYDYDGFVLISAMRNNFVRIALDYRNPDTKTNIEAIGMRQLQLATIWLNDFVGGKGLKRVIIVQRTGEAHKDGKAYVLDTPEQIEFFMKWGRILQDTF